MSSFTQTGLLILLLSILSLLSQAYFIPYDTHPQGAYTYYASDSDPYILPKRSNFRQQEKREFNANDLTLRFGKRASYNADALALRFGRR